MLILLLIVVAYGAAVAGVLLLEHRLRRPHGVTVPDRLGPVQVAYLIGGGERAVHTALGMLRSVGLVDARNGLVEAVLPVRDELSALERVIHRSLTERPQPVHRLHRGRAVRRALGEVRQGLERAGLYAH